MGALPCLTQPGGNPSPLQEDGVGWRPATTKSDGMWQNRLSTQPPNEVSSHVSGRALARAALGQEFPISTLSIVERVPSPAIAHVSSRPP
jgi:hypothetical protein